MNPTTDDLRRSGFTVKDGVMVKIPNSKQEIITDAFAPNQYQYEGKQESPLERIFMELWTKCGGPELEREVSLVPDRAFRCDFVHELSKVVVEVQGISDHTSIKGFHRDNAKHWELAKLGYRVITLDRKLINEDNVRELIKMVSK